MIDIFGAIHDMVLGMNGRNIISLDVNGAAVSFLPSSSVGDETALILGGDMGTRPQYWNLLGDHREGYKAAYEKGGVDALKAYYLENDPVCRSPYSEHEFESSAVGE